MSKYWRRISDFLGSLPARKVTWGLVLVFSIWIFLDIFVLRVSTGLAQSTYDTMVRARYFSAKHDPRIVIIDIDEASLAQMGKEYGRWPWSRDTLAAVLDYVERQEPAAVAWDILFSDADRLSPGGDAAFNEVVKKTKHSHFSVTRLPKANDGASEVNREILGALWVQEPAPPLAPGQKLSTVAMVAPALPAVANSRLGFNNGYVDNDGILRRYRYMERLPDGSRIQSLPMSVLRAVDPEAYRVRTLAHQSSPEDELIIWRGTADSYPRVSFADVYALADGTAAIAEVPSFAGKIVIIGSTAPSLHDIHPTPLSSMHGGVDALATALDNLLNHRHLVELPRLLKAVLAIALCAALAIWVKFKGAASLAPALLALPIALMGISFISLNGAPIFVDLYLSAGMALVFLAVLRTWTAMRLQYWCSPPVGDQPIMLWPWERRTAWLEGPLGRLIDAVEKHAPNCRIVVCDSNITWPATLRWPELARFAAVVGPPAELLEARPQLERAIRKIARRDAEPLLLNTSIDREKLAQNVFMAWSRMQKDDTTST